MRRSPVSEHESNGKPVNQYGISLREFFNEKVERIWDAIKGIREVQRDAWNSHDKLHATRDKSQEKIDNELNDVRHRFVPREVFETELENTKEQLENDIKNLRNTQYALLLLLVGSLVGAIVDIATR